MGTVLALVWFILTPDPAVSLQQQFLQFREVLAFGEFEGASRISTAPDGTILIVDRSGNQVVVFDLPTQAGKVIGGFGWGETSFDEPTGVASDGLNLYVADRGNHRIQRLDRNLTLISSLFKRDTTLSRGRFGYPEGITLSRHGDLIILDGENIRVVMYTGDYRFLRSFGDVEGGGKMLVHPVDVDIDERDHIFVLETGRVVEFDYFGNYIRSIGTGVISEAKGFSVGRSHTAVVSTDSLWVMDRTGGRIHAVGRGEIISSQLLNAFSDAAWNGDQLYLLTKDECFLFDVVSDAEN